MKDLPNLDVLRAVAVLLVAAEHILVTFQVIDIGFGSAYNLGKVGVFIFFVHTSLVLMHSLERRDRSTWSLFLPFYVRRVFRIYPLAIVCILLALLFHIPPNSWGATYEFPGYGRVISNLLLVQNLTHPMQDSVIGPLWTLPVELQMYAVLPLLYIVAGRLQSRNVLLATYVMAIVLGLIQPVVSYRANLLAYGPCFMGGVLAYFLARTGYPRRKLPAVAWPLAILAVTVLFIALESLIPSQIQRGWIMCFVLGLTIPLFAQMPGSVVTRCGFLIAKYSFGIYLAHVPALWLAFTVLADQSAWVQWLTFSAVFAGAPVALYHTIEEPGIALGQVCAARFERMRPRSSMVPQV